MFLHLNLCALSVYIKMEVHSFFFIISAALIRYQIAGNFLGLPAVTVPVRNLLLLIFMIFILRIDR